MFSYELRTSPNNDAFRVSVLKFDDDVQVIADPVWDGGDPLDILSLESTFRNTQLILLSHSTPEFLSGYALLCQSFPSLLSNVPVFSTVAVSQLGRVSTVEFYRSHGYLGPVKTAFLELSDIDEYFDRITLIKYYQNVSVLENRLLLSAYNAGHSLGGSFWLLARKAERVIYAPSWNVSKDTFLNGAAFLSTANGNALPSLTRPTALITGGTIGSALSHKRRVEKFLNLIDATLANGGAILLPTNISGRFLELLHIVDEHLSMLQGAAIPVYFLSYTGTKILGYASNLSDWMSSLVMKEFEGGIGSERAFEDTPMDPSKVDLLLDPVELIKYPGPKVVFASGLDIDEGDQSSEALRLLCMDEKTTIVLTERPLMKLAKSLASDLYLQWCESVSLKNSGVLEDGYPVPLEKSLSSSHFLEEEGLKDSELQAFKTKIQERRKIKAIEKIKDKRAKQLLNTSLLSDESEDEEESSSSEEDESLSTKDSTQNLVNTNNGEAQPSAAVNEAYITDYVVENLDSNKPVDIRVTSKFRSRQAMFPVRSSKRKKLDDYGELIDPKDFQRSDDNIQNSRLINESKKNFEALLGDYKQSGVLKRSRRNQDNSNLENKLTPQQTLNNQILQKYLDSLYRPVKRVPLRKESVNVRCGLSYVDLAGDVDIRSFNLIISSVRPTNLIVLPDYTYREQPSKGIDGVFAIQKSIESFQQNRQKEGKLSEETSRQIRSSSILEKHISRNYNTTEMSLNLAKYNDAITILGKGQGGGNDFLLHIDEDLWKTIKWKRLTSNYRLAHVEGLIDTKWRFRDEDTDQESQHSYLKPINYDNAPGLDTKDNGRPLNLAKLAVGNVRLPELKRRLKELNMNAEFKGEGTLMVDDQVAVKKVTAIAGSNDDAGDIIIEGHISLLYYKVKRCVKDMLAYV